MLSLLLIGGFQAQVLNKVTRFDLFCLFRAVGFNEANIELGPSFSCGAYGLKAQVLNNILNSRLGSRPTFE